MENEQKVWQLAVAFEALRVPNTNNYYDCQPTNCSLKTFTFHLLPPANGEALCEGSTTDDDCFIRWCQIDQAQQSDQTQIHNFWTQNRIFFRLRTEEVDNRGKAQGVDNRGKAQGVDNKDWRSGK
ncbi:hypothetical protein H6P81_012122 [Aristolochia fimbriata]|uniref:Uncharacterized protein n=1 Tax=Aristolochia fimbriata TaxID=158543 RepID=A0AAV7EBG2_ARIFI|nr:hypothetical protein H6P81_012122 [Aristolochia fimbriata]